MAYQLTYWESDGSGHAELRNVRLKSIQEAFPLSLEHNRPNGTSLITVDRTDDQSENEMIIWEEGMDYPASPKTAKKAKRISIRNKV